YVLPRKTTDAVLPIDVEPKPAQLVRVLVGRAEVITPEMEKAVKQEVGRLSDPSPKVRDEAFLEIRKHGRFSEPILKQILADETDTATRSRIKALIAKPAISD